MKCPTFLMFLSVLFTAQPGALMAMQQAMPPVDVAARSNALRAADRQDVVAKLSEALRERYVFPEVGERAAATIERALSAGEYETLAEPAAFTSRLSADVDAIVHDKHLKIWSTASPPPLPGKDGGMPRNEVGIVRADKLAGGIGYIEVVAFPPRRAFKRVVDRAMSGLVGSRALIIDVRRNGGGSPESVAYLVSFLIAPDQPINDIVSRVEKTKNFRRESYRSMPTPVSFAKVPVYVLTSKDTFSGGEEFAYDVQALKRATVIGEVTGGGANPTGFVDLGHDIAAMIPFGRAENPITKANWEGRGVQPDVPVSADETLATALKRAGEKPIKEVAAASRQQIFAPRSIPLPGTEAALRRLIAGYSSGKPDYTAMTPDLADMTRTQLPNLQAQFTALGELRSVRFHGPDMLGGDEYELHFANGDRMMALLLDQSGKVLAVSTPMPLPGGQ